MCSKTMKLKIQNYVLKIKNEVCLPWPFLSAQFIPIKDPEHIHIYICGKNFSLTEAHSTQPSEDSWNIWFRAV